MKNLCALAILLLASPAFAQPANWGGAKWVWDEADADKVVQTDEPRYLRCTFDLSAKPKAAELWITADNTYKVYVNGQAVGSGKEWQVIDKYNVLKHLVVGKNVLAIKATNAGGPAGVIARLHIKNANKKDMFVVTNDKTKIQRAGSVSDGKWHKAAFEDSKWSTAIPLGEPSMPPWNLSGGGTSGDRFGYGFNKVDPKVTKRLSAQEELKHFVVPKDFVVELVATDPVIINPITMTLDDKGRIIVSESHTYRYGKSGSPVKPFSNPVIRLDPDGKGGFTRTLIADGFDDPVMGIAVKGDKLWLTACDKLYTYDLPASPPSPLGEGPGVRAPGQKKPLDKKNTTIGKTPSPPTPLPKGEGSKIPLAINKKAILTDHNKAWNPFGMFVLEWGPDGKLYMSVGDHRIDIRGPDGGKISARGNSGMIMRMNPDGTKMERLVHGLRVPYSFEYDPFGQLWLLSNGEGNPDRFVRVIEGVDYHCYSRPGISNEWLAGRHPLAPPCEEVHGGAHTQLMRYFAANFPKEYQGNLFCCNWGRHGFAGANRGIFRFVLDDRNNVVKKDTLVACTDPHFRPSHIHLDIDGSLLIADWYGRDDESDMTGRIWRLKYVGKDRPIVKHKLDSAEWKKNSLNTYAIEALGSPDHMIRRKAMELLAKGDYTTACALGAHAWQSKTPLGAANALWAIVQMNKEPHRLFISSGIENPDWRVRRLTHDLMRRYNIEPPRENLTDFKENDPAVLLSSALLAKPANVVDRLANATKSGAASDRHLRYEAAWHLAKHADEKAIASLLTSDDADVRLAGLIAIDVACFDDFPRKKAALAALGKALENPGKLDQQLLLEVARLDGDASIVPALEKLIARDDLPTATLFKAVLVLKAKSNPSLARRANEKAGKRLIAAVEKGTLRIASPADQLVIFEFLESEGPTPFALKQIAGQLRSGNKDLKQAAHTLARRFGTKASSLADGLWPSVLNPRTRFEDRLEFLSTIARVEAKPNPEAWKKVLNHGDPFLREEAARWWLTFKDVPSPGKRDPQLPKEELTKYSLAELAKMPAADRSKRAVMGLQVFERNACTKCHTTATATTLLAPSLKGVGQQKVEYLIESVLFPSKIIKTGWEVEVIELKSGKTLSGLVKDEGKHLRVLNLDKDDRILKTDIESRSTSKISVMPEGQEATLSRREFVDLIAYLQTLK